MEKVKINYDRTYSSKYTRDYYRGKSFHYAGRWEVGARYVCDEYNADFVVHDSLLLICKKNHTATRNNEPIHLEELDNGLVGLQSDYWDVVLPALYGGSEYVVLGIEQERGTNVLHAMSQAATTRELEGIESVIEENREQINGDLQTLRTTVSRNAEEISSRAELIENDIATKWSEILQTADSIRTTVATNKSETDESLRNLQTNITQTADTLRSEATAMREDIEWEIHNLSSTITQTASEIRSEVSDLQTNLEGQISGAQSSWSQTAEQINSRVENIEEDVATKWSEINQTADAISATVTANKTDADNNFSQLQSDLTITADTIRSEVSEVVNRIDGDISDTRSSITQTASEIRSEVESTVTDINGEIDTVKSSITQTASDIRSEIEATKTDLEGTISSNYSELKQTAEGISATVAANKTATDESISDLSSNITQTATEIRSEVNQKITEVDGKIEEAKSSISQTAEQIMATVEANKTELDGTISANYSELKQTAEEISSTVASNKEAAEDALDAVNEELSSRITQTSEAITSEVEARTTREGEIVTDYTSKIEQTANAITSEVAAREALGERVTTAESSIRQNAEDISARVTKTDYNTDQETVNTKITDIVADTEGIHTSVSTIEQTLESQGTVIGQYATRLTSLENQADNAIETWYYYGAPTLENVPASVWTDNKTKDNHIGDLYYDRNTGYSYRFFKNGDVYSWSLMQDSDITKAIRNAAAAQETADGKMKVFTSTPYTPYQVGDLWVQGHTDNNDGTIYKCITDRESGVFNAADWAVASDFTSFKEVRSNFDIMADAIEGKVGTYDESGLIKGSTYSRIKQTRDNISLEIGTAKNEAVDTVTDGLSNTGINISDKKISLTADNIILKSNSGQRALEIVNDAEGKPLIAVSNLDVDSLRVKHLDGADGTFSGTLSAANGSFSGDVTATSLTLSGDLKIPYSKISDTPSIPTKAGDLTNDGTYITPTSITTLDVTAENLKVKAANIDGTLQVGNIPDLSGTYLTEHQSLADYMQTGTYIENGFIKTGFINTSAIQIGSGQVTGLGNLATKNKVDASTDVNGLSTVATSGNYNDLDGKPSIPDTSNLADKDAFAQKLGYTNYAALEAAAREGTTIIEGGHLRTSLIDADALRVNSANIDGTITATNLNAATGTFKGALSGVTGDFTGTVHATTLTLGDNVVIDRSHLDIPEGEDMSAYVTNDSLSNTLQSYALSSSLSAYTTNEALGQTLQNYLTSSAAENTYLKPSGLAGYIKTNVGIGSDNADSTYFIVDTNGLLTAKNAIITGQINATSGYIGGIAIGNNGIASDNNNFSVDKNGNVIANSITLANGAISSGINTYGFTFGKTNNIAYLYNGKSSLNTSGEGVYIGTDGIALGNSFKVTKNGTITLSYNSLSDKPSIPADVADLTDNNGTYITPTSLSTINVTAQNLKVSAANITGTLAIGNIPDLSSKYLTEHQSLAGYMNESTYIQGGFIKTSYINASAITIGSSQVTGLGSLATKDNIGTSDLDSTIISGGYIKTGLIKASELQVSAANITGTLTASQIDATNLHVSAANIDGTITATNLNAATGTFKGTLSAATGSFSGSITAESGNIGGWIIQPNYLDLYDPDNDFHKLRIGYWEDDRSGHYYVFAAGEDWENSDDFNFAIDDKGYMYAQGGKIGGFNIGTSKLYNGLATLSGTTDGVYLGTDGIALGGGKFKVTKAGYLTTASGRIAQFIVDSEKLSYGFQHDNHTISYFDLTTKGMTVGLKDDDYDSLIYDFSINIEDSSNSAVCTITRHASAGTALKIDVGQTGSTAIEIYDAALYSTYICPDEIYIYNTQSRTIPIDISATSASIITCNVGMFAGLRPKTRYITSSSTSSERYLDSLDYNIVVNNSSSLTLYLPSSPKAGQTYYIMHTTATTLNIHSSSTNIFSMYTNASASDVTFNARGTLLVVWNASQSKWICDILSSY